MKTPLRIALVVALGLPTSANARLDILTVGKFARLERRVFEPKAHGVVVVGRDRALRVLHDPTCPTPSRFALVSRVESMARREIVAVELDCAKWTAHGRGWRYRHGDGGVRSIRYARDGLRIVLGGPDITVQGPVNVLQADLAIGDTTLRARFQNFVTDVKDAIVTWRTSPNAAAGEAAFWDVILGEASSEERQQAALQALERAVTSHPHDGRSRFLLGMLRLYRFRQSPPGSQEALVEIRKSDASLQRARPLLWDEDRRVLFGEDHRAGDSRILVFAATARYLLGVATDDAAMRAQALTDLAEGARVNPLFNTVGYHFVAASAPRTSADFAQAFAKLDAYNATVDPSCFVTLPEVCANAGMAPRNFPGSPLLIGDLYAKAGQLARAQEWYMIADAFSTPEYRFPAVIADRQRNAAERVALYLDGDPSNDPPVIGAGPDACALCHKR